MTDKEIGKILKEMIVLVDTREQKNKHITDLLDEKGIRWENEKLLSGDYTFYLPNNKDLGLDKSILIERKNSLDELAGNFTKGRERFVKEFERTNSEIHLLVEKATFTKLLNESYRSKLPANAYMANLFTWNARYSSPVWFCKTEQSPIVIYYILHYGLRNKLKNIQKNT